ncbi:MAG: class F sortase [Candidatus Nomurabacteria bacterium]|nr:MAG: class F sortase [Candidatus Nomurabacteria bacterium]
MQRRTSLLSAFAALMVGVNLCVTVWAATPAYSSENPHTQELALPQAAQNSSQNSPSSSISKPQVFTASTKNVSAAQPAKPRAAAVVGNSLSIPSIGFQSSIIEVGVTATNNIDVPSSLQVGHWIGSARPGVDGAAFLDGHVDGVFAKLHSVREGQIISVNYGGQTFKYRVVHTETVPLVDIDMGKALSVYGDGSQGLNLMTCAGTYVATQGTYDHRLVVYAVRVS